MVLHIYALYCICMDIFAYMCKYVHMQHSAYICIKINTNNMQTQQDMQIMQNMHLLAQITIAVQGRLAVA